MLRSGKLVGIAVFVLALGIRTWAAEEAFWLDLQAEEFDKAVLHPDWHTETGQGWYAMEQRYFSGYAGAICDSQSLGAEMTYTVDTPIPAGKHKFFLHLLRMRSGGKNGVRITVGDQRWDVIWSDKSYPVRDYAVDMHELTLAQPVKQITIKSLVVERHNIGDVPSYPIPTIMLDRLQVTNDLRQQPITVGRRMAVGIPAEAAQTPATPGQKEAEQPIPPGNRLRNGSFEVATTTTWFGDQRYRGSVVLKPMNIVEGQAAHGRRHLVYPAEGQDVGRQAWGIFSNVFPGRSGETVPVSLMLKSSGSVKMDVFIYNSKRRGVNVVKGRDLTNAWQKVTGTAKLPFDKNGKYYLLIQSNIEQGSDARLHIDAVSVGLPPDAEYQSHDRREAGLASEKVANIYHDKDRAPALLSLANHDKAPWQADFELVVRDHRETVVARRPLKETVAAGRSAKKTLDVNCGRWGIFSAVVRDKAEGRDLAELCYVAIPRREKKTPGMCGLYGQTDHDYTMALMSELGLGWNGTLADGTAQHIVPPERWDMLDRVLATPPKHGIKTHYCAEILMHKRQEDLHYEGTTGRHHHPPSLPALEKDLYEFAKRFGDKIDVWSLMDELVDHKCPRDVWPLYHKAAADAIRRADPDAVIGVSAGPEFQEQVLKVLGKKYLDGIIDATFGPMGGARFKHAPYAKLAREWGLPLWFSGFSFTTRSYYRTRHADLGYQSIDYTHQVDNVAAGMTVHRLEFAPERFILYSAIPSILGPVQLRRTNIYDTDGTIVAAAASYAAIGLFLEDATDGVKLESPHIDLSAFSFKRLGDNWLTFSVDPGQAFYGSIRRGNYVLELPLAGTFFDSFGNEYPVDINGQTAVIHFEGQPVYLNAGKTSAEAIAEALKNAKFTSVFDLRAYCAGDEAGGTCVKVVVANNSDKTIDDQLALSEGRNLFPTETALTHDIMALGPNKRTVFTIPAAKGAAVRRPLTQGAVSARLMSGRANARCSLWAASAPSMSTAPTLDGSLGEWKGLPTAFIHATKRASGGYALMQVLRGAEKVQDEDEIGARISAGWDAENLYLMFRAKDDEVTFPAKGEDLGKGDRACICIDAQLEADLFDAKVSDDDFVIEICVVGDEPQVSLVSIDGKKTPLPAGFGRVLAGKDSGWAVEIACPWAKLGLKPSVGAALGFGATIIDADGSLDDQIEAAWGVFGYSMQSPIGYGQLILR